MSRCFFFLLSFLPSILVLCPPLLPLSSLPLPPKEIGRGHLLLVPHLLYPLHIALLARRSHFLSKQSMKLDQHAGAAGILDKILTAAANRDNMFEGNIARKKKRLWVKNRPWGLIIIIIINNSMCVYIKYVCVYLYNKSSKKPQSVAVLLQQKE